jgi:hypothetical protein
VKILLEADAPTPGVPSRKIPLDKPERQTVQNPFHPFNDLLAEKGQKHEAEKEFYDELDPGIRRHVRILRDNGVRTCQSCQGGRGYAYPQPTVDFFWDWGREVKSANVIVPKSALIESWNDLVGVGLRAVEIAAHYGLEPAYLRHEWREEDGELVEPTWALDFGPPRSIHTNLDVLSMTPPRFRRAAELLQHNGIDVFSACEGGSGHVFPKATICFRGDASEGCRAFNLITSDQKIVSDLWRCWPVRGSGLDDPYWEVKLARSIRDDDRSNLEQCQEYWNLVFNAKKGVYE